MKLSEYQRKLGWIKEKCDLALSSTKRDCASGASGHLQDVEMIALELQQVTEVEDDA